MFLVMDSASEVIAAVSCGEEYTLSNSGRYSVKTVNHGGWSQEIHFTLSLNSPTAELAANAGSKLLEVKIQPSADGGATLTGVKIYKVRYR
jgi:antitoxin (DNA-binding transcriptional repressor) of toxin-antitoxin stability system